jgi:hypothetical protein
MITPFAGAVDELPATESSGLKIGRISRTRMKSEESREP